MEAYKPRSFIFGVNKEEKKDNVFGVLGSHERGFVIDQPVDKPPEREPVSQMRGYIFLGATLFIPLGVMTEGNFVGEWTNMIGDSNDVKAWEATF